MHLIDLDIGFCRHCQDCHKKILHCSIEDSVPAILRKMLEADGIIIASPNYLNHITGLMKAFFDRSTHFIHCKRLLGKYLTGVVSSGSGHDKGVLDYIKFYAHICGAQYSGGISCAIPLNQAKIKEAFELGESLAQDIKNKRIYPDQIDIIEKSKEHFKRLILLRKEEWPQEYQYWQGRGWL